VQSERNVNLYGLHIGLTNESSACLHGLYTTISYGFFMQIGFYVVLYREFSVVFKPAVD